MQLQLLEVLVKGVFRCAVQCCYGAVIVTFLGAVHWGLAMATPMTSPMAYTLASEAYMWSVTPSLMAWPITLFEPGE